MILIETQIEQLLCANSKRRVFAQLKNHVSLIDEHHQRRSKLELLHLGWFESWVMGVVIT